MNGNAQFIHSSTTLACTGRALRRGSVAEYDGHWAIRLGEYCGQSTYLATWYGNVRASHVSLGDTLAWLTAHGVNVNDVTFTTVL